MILVAACASASPAEGSRAVRTGAPGEQSGSSAAVASLPSSAHSEPAPSGLRVRPSAEEFAAGIAWRFHAGAPLPGAPAVAADGSVYTAGTDGYVHALDRDGAFRWSYTVTGRVVGAPGVDASGRLYLATAAHRVYALTPRGHKWWLFNAPASPTSGVAVTAEGVVYFVGSDDHLWALSPRAVVLFRTKLDGMASASPVAAAHGVLVGTSTGKLSVIRGAADRWDVALGDAIRAVTVEDGPVYVISGTTLVALQIGNAAPRWTRSGSTFVAPAGKGRLVVTGTDGTVAFVSTSDGTEISKLDLAAAASAAPAVLGELAFVPCDDGALRVVHTDRKVVAVVSVTRAPLLEPAITGDTVVVASGDGTIAGIDASRWRRDGL